ncbi:MAG: hypothetical protein ACJAZP_002537 [Psychromonas sp.]|jgi:hypothetical protein
MPKTASYIQIISAHFCGLNSDRSGKTEDLAAEIESKPAPEAGLKSK